MKKLKIKATKSFIRELSFLEQGRHEDALIAREKMTPDMVKQSGYATTVNDFIHRQKTTILVKTPEEAIELYKACALGIIGEKGYKKQADRIMQELKPTIETLAPNLALNFPES